MNDPFFNLYHIIVDTCFNSNFNLSYFYFNELGDNNPFGLVDTTVFKNDFDIEIDYLRKRKIIFHDQEPILFDNFAKEWDIRIATANRLQTNHILSNSEINSADKDKLLSKSGWSDFYWFSNGFLSLDWYRYYRYANYLEHNWSPTKTFSSYNRILKDRQHRLLIANHLYNNYQDKCVLSCHSDDGANNIFINTSNNISTNLSYKIDVPDFIDSFCHIVTERIFYEDRIHLTEKAFRPIVCCRPFILVSSPGTLKYLKNYGFKTFDKFWSEDYDNIINHDKRIESVCSIIDKLGSLSQSEILNMLNAMKDILLYNRRHFYGLFETNITNELYTNLYAALAHTNTKESIFKQILANLTIAELDLIKNSNVELDFDNPEEDYFQQSVLTNTLNNTFKKDTDEQVIRPFVIKYLKHFKYYYTSFSSF